MSVSATEIIMWSVGSPLLSGAAAGALPSPLAFLPSPTEIPLSARSRSDAYAVYSQQQETHQQQIQQQFQPSQVQRTQHPRSAPGMHAPPLQLEGNTSRAKNGSPTHKEMSQLKPVSSLVKHIPPDAAVSCHAESTLPICSFDGVAATAPRAAPGFATAPNAATAASAVAAAVAAVRPLISAAPHASASPVTQAVPGEPAAANSTSSSVPPLPTEAAARSLPSGNERVEERIVYPHRKTKGQGFPKPKPCLPPNVEVFPGSLVAVAGVKSNVESEQSLAVNQEHDSPLDQTHFFTRGAAARHVIGTAVAGSRSSCLWRPLKGTKRMFTAQKMRLSNYTVLKSSTGRFAGISL